MAFGTFESLSNSALAIRIAVCMALGTLLVPAARAADAAAAVSQDDTLATIIVTALKRKESLQIVPVSVTAFSTEELQQRSLDTLQELAQSTPNVAFYNQGQAGRSAGQVFIRGIGQTDPLITNDPGVGVYVDGVYIGRMQALDLGTMDIERVEILRGPQGTLFGMNTIGGAINIITNKPSLDMSSGEAQVTTGSYSRIDGLARISVPLVTDRLAVSLSVASRNQDGYGMRISDGQGMGNVDTLTARLAVLFKASDDLDFLLSFDRTRVREQGAVDKLLAVSVPPPVAFLNAVSNPPYDSRWITSSDFTSYATGGNLNDADVYGTSLTATWKLTAATIKSITSYRSTDSSYGVDPDGSPLTLINETDRTQQHQFSQELQFSGLSFNNRLNWVAGLYYFSEQATENVHDGVFTALAPFGVDISFNTDLGIDNKAYAAYGQGTYKVTHQLHLTVGVRETREDKSGSELMYVPDTNTVTIPYVQKSASWDSFTPRVSVEYQFTPDVMSYVSAANGFKSGGFNGRADATAGFKSYQPETAWTYEAGIRSELHDKRLRLNATVYYTIYNDIQFTVIQGTASGTPNTVIGNAAKAHISGGELEIDAVPVQHLTLRASVGLTDAKYMEVAAGAPITTASVFQDTPKWSGTVGAEYLIPVSARLEALARADLSYRSQAYLDAANSPLLVQGAYSLVNARLTLREPGRGWSVSVFGTNLTDKRFMTGGTDFLNSLGFAQAYFGAPREWGATLDYRF